MTARVRRAGVVAVVAALVAAVVAVAGGVRLAAAAALLERGHRAAPYALVRPLWTDVGVSAGAGSPSVSPDARERARDAMAIMRRAQRGGVLAAVLGSRPVRVVQLGDLQDRGRTVGVTALLALPVARHDVQATVPAVAPAPPAGLRTTTVRFRAPVLRDVLVDVDLRRGAIVAVQPGPASRTSAWAAPPSTAPS